jgi:MFS family permease
VIFLYLNTAMSPALPSIAQYFDISDTLASWVMTAYMVCGAVMTVIMGKLSDLVGAKKMLMLMMVCFTVGTILAPFAHNISRFQKPNFLLASVYIFQHILAEWH